MAASDAVVEGVDPFKHHNLVFPQPERGPPAVVAHLADKLILGDQDLLPPAQGSKVPVQQLHVQAERGLEIQLSLRGAGRGLWIGGFKVVVHGHRMGVHPPPLELLRDFHGGGGLAGAGWTGQQDDGAGLQVGQDLIRGQRDTLGIVLVALRQKFRHIALDAAVDLL